MNKSKKILICLPFFSLGGAETQAFLLANFLNNNVNFDVTICAFYKKDGRLMDLLEKNNIKYILYNADLSLLHKKGFRKIRMILKFGFFLRKGAYDYIIPFTYYPNLLCNIAKLVARAKKCFWNQRGMETLGVSKLERFAAFLKPLYIANSQACMQFIENRHKRTKINGVVIHNAVYVEKAEQSREYWREKINASGDEIIISCVANFFPEKDHTTLIKALSYLISQLKISSPVKLVLAGYTPDESFLNKAKALVFDLNLTNNVVFVESSSDISGLLNITDIGVLASLSEGSPNAILEYMAHKIPVVATAIPAIIEIFQNNHEFLFPVGNEICMAEKIKIFIEDPALRKREGERNYTNVINNFTLDKMVNGYLKLF